MTWQEAALKKSDVLTRPRFSTRSSNLNAEPLLIARVNSNKSRFFVDAISGHFDKLLPSRQASIERVTMKEINRSFSRLRFHKSRQFKKIRVDPMFDARVLDSSRREKNCRISRRLDKFRSRSRKKRQNAANGVDGYKARIKAAARKCVMHSHGVLASSNPKY